MTNSKDSFRFNGRPPALERFEENNRGKVIMELTLDENGRPQLQGLYEDTITDFFKNSEVLTGLMFSAQTGLQNFMRPAKDVDVKAGRADAEGQMIWDVRELKANEQMSAVTKCMGVVQKMLGDLQRMQEKSGKRPAAGGQSISNPTSESRMAEIEAKYETSD